MTAASIPLSYLSNKTAVKPSPIHGQGLFAIAPIRKGEIVCIKGGHIFTREHLTEMNARLGPAEIPIADDLFIGPVTEAERSGSMIWSNHSQVLRSGTAQVGEYLKNNCGTINVGACADLLLLDRNPLADVRNVDHPIGVMVRGRWFTVI